jgi:hypothetical protein
VTKTSLARVHILPSRRCTKPILLPGEFLAFLPPPQEHWYTLRRVEGAWWNLNSLLPAPEPLSDFYVRPRARDRTRRRACSGAVLGL